MKDEYKKRDAVSVLIVIVGVIAVIAIIIIISGVLNWNAWSGREKVFILSNLFLETIEYSKAIL